MIYRSGHIGCYHLLLFHREKPVAVDADDGPIRLDACKGLFYSSASASDIVAVYRSAQIII